MADPTPGDLSARLLLVAQAIKPIKGLQGMDTTVMEAIAALSALPDAPAGAVALVADWNRAADDLRGDGLYSCCASTYEQCAAHLEALSNPEQPDGWAGMTFDGKPIMCHPDIAERVEVALLTGMFDELSEHEQSPPAAASQIVDLEDELTHRAGEGWVTDETSLPAGGGVVAEVCMDQSGCKYLCWSPGLEELPAVGTKLCTTPQPSAAEELGPLGDWHEPAIAAECPHCVDGIVPMTEGRPCPRCNGVINDATVGAQGEVQGEREKVVALSDWLHDNRPEAERVLWAGDLVRIVRLIESAAPAAGKGVDDAMVERFCAAFFTPKWPTSSTHNDNVLRGMVRPALEAALTRQPVAGDGWRPIESAPENVEVWLFDPDTDPQQYAAVLTERDPDIGGLYWRPKESLVAEMLDYELTPTHWMPLPDAPAATPTDGGEG